MIFGYMMGTTSFIRSIYIGPHGLQSKIIVVHQPTELCILKDYYQCILKIARTEYGAKGPSSWQSYTSCHPFWTILLSRDLFQLRFVYGVSFPLAYSFFLWGLRPQPYVTRPLEDLSFPSRLSVRLEGSRSSCDSVAYLLVCYLFKL